MDRHAGDDDGDQAPQAPGTLALEDFQLSGNSLILHPIPTADPNDPLNWSFWRKTVNISLVMLYVTLTFTQLDIGLVAYEQYLDELGFSVNDLNGANALGYAGLGFGSVFFIPLMHKYGRRPVYIASLTLQVGACIWLALTKTKADLWVGNALAGLGGAVCETIVQVTIADIFFVHQHASLNAYYLFFTSVGASLAPVAAGYVVESQGWRWIWWWSVILIATNLVLVIFLFEESKYVVVIDGQDDSNPQDSRHDEAAEEMDPAKGSDVIVQTRSHRNINSRIPAKSYRQRMALLTTTDGPVFGHILDPFVVLATFPAVTFAAITFGSLLALFALLAAVQAIYLLEPPYNFSAIGVGLMNLAPFIAGIPGMIVGGWLDDWSIVWLSKRNGGLYEPEMRLWLALPCAITTPASVLMVGLGLSYGASWPVIAIGFGFYGFSFSVAGGIALSYAMDCYHAIVGSSMIGIIFMRNAFAVVVLFALTPWIEGMGLRNMHILLTVITFAIQLLPVAMLIWGKKARVASAKRYLERASRQPTHRPF